MLIFYIDHGDDFNVTNVKEAFGEGFNFYCEKLKNHFFRSTFDLTDHYQLYRLHGNIGLNTISAGQLEDYKQLITFSFII